MSIVTPGRTPRGKSPDRPAGQDAAGGAAAAAAEAPACGHGAAHETATPEGEIVCRACGMVKGEDGRQAGPASLPRCRTNLYLEMEVGGRPDRRLRADRFVRRRSDMAAVSNISQKLGIPNGAGRDVWAWYLRLRRAPGMRMTKAKILVLAFCGVCRMWGCPLNEDRLRDIIRMEMGVRNAHSYLHVIMEASSYVDAGTGEHALRKTGFLDMMERCAPGSPAARAAGGSPSPGRFSISTEIQSLAREYEPGVAEALAHEARAILPVLEQREPNRARAARAAIRIAKRRYGAR